MVSLERISALKSARAGPRPQTQRELPYRQMDQWPPAEFAYELIRRSLQLPQVQHRQSRMAAPETMALWLPQEVALGPASAFIDDREFCHLHPLPEGSIHLTLPKPARAKAVSLGWAEAHPTAAAGFLPETLVLVYAPRDVGELATILLLVELSYKFAGGEFGN